jgi:CheY-like chemotaxis protein
MKKKVDPLGRLLLRTGVLSEEGLADVLDNQRHTLPFASLCYVLGLSEEEPLVRALSKQRGVPGVVLDRCVISLTVLAGVPRETSLRHGILPLYEDANRLFVAMQDPSDTEILREIGFMKGKAVVPHVGLHVTIGRTLRLAYAAAARGEAFWYGPRAVGREPPESPGRMVVVSDVDQLGVHDLRSRSVPSHGEADYQELTDITRELFEDDSGANVHTSGSRSSLSIHDTTETGPAAGHAVASGDLRRPEATDGAGSESSSSGGSLHSSVELMPTPSEGVIDLDTGATPRPPTKTRPGAPARVLIVDDDFATRHLLVKQLAPHGYATDTAASGMEAVKRLRANPPDVVVIDIMLPEIDGFQICRSIKTSRKYRHIPVILMSAVIDSGRVTEDVLVRYGADAYFEKPINTEKLRRRMAELLAERTQSDVAAAAQPAADDGSFERALELYRQGRVDEAVEALRAGLAVDPLSTKHHFVLANLLQKQNLIYEAIDEYEATVNLKPDYFPALSRLAYLYYKKGFSAKAIDTWRRSLPHCPDPALRQNIEVFMRKLISEMQSEK